jgi:hypothetical protein
MNVAKLITILQTLPMDSKIQIGYYDDSEWQRVNDVTTLTFKEKREFEKFPNSNSPNRVILS